MFSQSPMKMRIQAAPACTYSVNKGDVHIYFDDVSEFNASLDILTDTEEKTNRFNALIYSYHNKEDERRNYNTLSIVNTGNLMIFKIIHNGGMRNFSISGDGINIISSKIAGGSRKISDQVIGGLSFPDEQSLGEHSKRLLEKFNLTVEILFYSIKQDESGLKVDPDVLTSILDLCSLLDKENDELRKVQAVKRSPK